MTSSYQETLVEQLKLLDYPSNFPISENDWNLLIDELYPENNKKLIRCEHNIPGLFGTTFLQTKHIVYIEVADDTLNNKNKIIKKGKNLEGFMNLYGPFGLIKIEVSRDNESQYQS